MNNTSSLSKTVIPVEVFTWHGLLSFYPHIKDSLLGQVLMLLAPAALIDLGEVSR